MNKFCVLIGGGNSIRKPSEEINLWERIVGLDLWSLNFAYKALPYPPKTQTFIDTQFFNNNSLALAQLAEKKVRIIAKAHSRYNTIKEIEQHFVTRNKSEYLGDKALEKNLIYIGRMGLCGIFALSLAIAEGYNTIYCLGFDFGTPVIGDTITHFYQNKINVASGGVGNPEIYYKHDGTIKNEVEDFEVFLTKNNSKIYNVSPNSNIPYFEKIDYSRFFELIESEKNKP